MPAIKEKFGERAVWYDSTDPCLPMIIRWRSVNFNIERLRLDREFLAFDLQVLKDRLTQLNKRADTPTKVRKICHFCRCRISAAASVCCVCRRTQPDSYKTIVERDGVVRQLVEASKAAPVEPKHKQNECLFCLDEIVLGTVICPACGMFQPAQLAELFQQDVSAMKVILDWQKQLGETGASQIEEEGTG